jgi:hypothetical protein
VKLKAGNRVQQERVTKKTQKTPSKNIKQALNHKKTHSTKSIVKRSSTSMQKSKALLKKSSMKL